MTFRHSNELLLCKANIVHDLMLHYGMLIYLKQCGNFEKWIMFKQNVTKLKKTKTHVSIHFRKQE